MASVILIAAVVGLLMLDLLALRFGVDSRDDITAPRQESLLAFS